MPRKAAVTDADKMRDIETYIHDDKSAPIIRLLEWHSMTAAKKR